MTIGRAISERLDPFENYSQSSNAEQLNKPVFKHQLCVAHLRQVVVVVVSGANTFVDVYALHPVIEVRRNPERGALSLNSLL